LWRGLCRALANLGHRIVFFERDVPYYAGTRDLSELPYGKLILYRHWEDICAVAGREIADSDAAIVTSFCPDARAASQLMEDASRPVHIFYDLDTPVTLSSLAKGEAVFYLGPEGLGGYDLVLSFTGGVALERLSTLLGASRPRPLYGHVDPDVHRPAAPQPQYQGALSYLGTYAADRQAKLAELLLRPAALSPHERFVIGGAQYPDTFPWLPNLHFVRHLPPSEHPSFYSSSRFTLNITRDAMAIMGYCPSGRLFEAAACSSAILTDHWDGLDQFLTPGHEVLTVRTTDDVLDALAMTDAETAHIAHRARERVLDEHSSSRRAIDLVREIEDARIPLSPPVQRAVSRLEA
jgi:spore maturation protein CgeB